MKKRIGIITMNIETAGFYKGLLDSLFGGFAEAIPYSFEDRSVYSMLSCDLYLLSSTSYDLGRNAELLELIPEEALIVKSRLTFTKEAISKLSGFKKGTKALLANQSQHMALESISQLYHLGISNIEFQPFYPELGKVQEAELVVAPGELRYVPENVGQVVDLGCRVLSIDTISEIALKLGNSTFLESEAFERYALSLAAADYSLKELTLSNLTLENKLEIIINSLDVGIVMMDENGSITIANTAAEEILNLGSGGLVGKSVDSILPAIQLELCRNAKAPFEPQLVNINDININLTITPLHVRKQYLGACVMIQKFEDGENKQNKLRLQMMEKAYRAKYTFDDIVGESPALRKACDIARRMAGNNASVILEGDSGTGKEMFAQAIHNASPRRNHPFIAINCAALPETLLESELFGYEDGAFTGARKGGKAGLFEFAHRGSVFLDEIESMSASLQAKLLRVLQEREVTRIGSYRSIVVDVRVISATNRNLVEMMQKGDFRKDLYYRLSVMPIHIPSLKERGQDVLLLMEYFKKQLRTSFVLTERAREALLHHSWDGNVRELRNYVEYLKYMEKAAVDLEDLPGAFLQTPAASQESKLQSRPGELKENEWLILQAINAANIQGKGAGRQYIASFCAKQGKNRSDYEIRRGMELLRLQGHIKVGQGRGGSRLTDSGRSLLPVKL